MLIQRVVSRAVRTYLRYTPTQRGTHFLREKTSPWLVARLDTGPWIRVSGVSSFEWSALRGQKSPEAGTMDRFLGFLKPGATVLDVGANIGYYSLTTAARIGPSGRVLSFEPNPTAANRLRENISLNRLPNITVIQAAVSTKPGRMKFVLGDDSEGSSLFEGVSDRIGEVEVEVTTIDDELAKAKIDRVDFMKMDVEGAEIQALSGASKLLSGPNAPPLLLEANPVMLRAGGASMDDMRRCVESFGYRITIVESLRWRGEVCENWLAQKN